MGFLAFFVVGTALGCVLIGKAFWSATDVRWIVGTLGFWAAFLGAVGLLA